MKRILLLTALLIAASATRLPAPAPRSMTVTKTCPSPQAPGASYTCSFTIINNYLADGVTNLRVTDTVPSPGGTTSGLLDCHLWDTSITTDLGPFGSVDGGGHPLDRCTGTINETAPASCSANQTDQIFALGDANDASCSDCSSGFGNATINNYTCTPGPTNTFTPTRTPTPTSDVRLQVIKTCPGGPFNPGDTVACNFSVRNMDASSGVTGLTVTDTAPYPGGSSVAYGCYQLDSTFTWISVTALGPFGSPTDTCTDGPAFLGGLTETAPACLAGGPTSQTDRLVANATDGGHLSTGSATASFSVNQCTPTPSPTGATPTRTPTPPGPTNTPTVTSGGPTLTSTPTPTFTVTPGGAYHLEVIKTCPAGAGPGVTFTCNFSVQNFTSGVVTGLTIRNHIPDAIADPTGTVISPCYSNLTSNPTTVLSGFGDDAGDTCQGTLTETAPLCGIAPLTDTLTAVAATGHGAAQGSASASVAVIGCTPTPTGTATATKTPTPTETLGPGTPSKTPTITMTFTNSPTGTITPPTNTPTVTNTPTITPTGTFTALPTFTPTIAPYCTGTPSITVTGPSSGAFCSKMNYHAAATGGTPPYRYWWNCDYNQAQPIFFQGSADAVCTYPKPGHYIVESQVRDSAGHRGFCGKNVEALNIPCSSPTPTPTFTRTPTVTPTPTACVANAGADKHYYYCQPSSPFCGPADPTGHWINSPPSFLGDPGNSITLSANTIVGGTWTFVSMVGWTGTCTGVTFSDVHDPHSTISCSGGTHPTFNYLLPGAKGITLRWTGTGACTSNDTVLVDIQVEFPS